LAKLERGEADVTLLAAAGLDRLGQSEVGSKLDADDWLPAPAQGAIGIECNSDDADTRAVIGAINDPESRATVMAERALLEALGGTCHSPIAVLSTFTDGMIEMKASLFSANGAERQDGSVTCEANAIDEIRAFGHDLLGRSDPAISCLFESK
jgi:hydroxymethylbilane synthase